MQNLVGPYIQENMSRFLFFSSSPGRPTSSSEPRNAGLPSEDLRQGHGTSGERALLFWRTIYNGRYHGAAVGASVLVGSQAV